MDASAGEEATTATAEPNDTRTFGLLLLALDCTQASSTAAASLYHHGIVHVVRATYETRRYARSVNNNARVLCCAR
jgi:hypothetical protein